MFLEQGILALANQLFMDFKHQWLVGGGSVMNGASPSSLFKTNLSATSVSQEVGSFRHLANPEALCLFRLVGWIITVLLKLSTVDSMRLKYAESGAHI